MSDSFAKAEQIRGDMHAQNEAEMQRLQEQERLKKAQELGMKNVDRAQKAEDASINQKARNELLQ